jgi:hypothetical protein
VAAAAEHYWDSKSGHEGNVACKNDENKAKIDSSDEDVFEVLK